MEPQKEVPTMANQIQSCFRRYEKKYRLTAAQQRFLLAGMAPYMK